MAEQLDGVLLGLVPGIRTIDGAVYCQDFPGPDDQGVDCCRFGHRAVGDQLLVHYRRWHWYLF